MSVEFRDSQTKDNLMKAFVGESQARNRYTFAAATAKQQNLHVIENIFTLTADQEKEHAEIFYNHLKGMVGGIVDVQGTYPVDLFDDVLSLLRAAQHNEYEEHDPVYKSFGDIAKEEGFLNIATSFHQIAEIEKTHGDRFGRFADMMEQNNLFTSDMGTQWMCLNCGHVHAEQGAPQVCPVCQHNQGYFVRLNESPFQE